MGKQCDTDGADLDAILQAESYSDILREIENARENRTAFYADTSDAKQ